MSPTDFFHRKMSFPHKCHHQHRFSITFASLVVYQIFKRKQICPLATPSGWEHESPLFLPQVVHWSQKRKALVLDVNDLSQPTPELEYMVVARHRTLWCLAPAVLVSIHTSVLSTCSKIKKSQMGPKMLLYLDCTAWCSTAVQLGNIKVGRKLSRFINSFTSFVGDSEVFYI